MKEKEFLRDRRRKDLAFAKAQRDEELKVAVQKLQTIVVKRTRASFELLAEHVLASRKALAERRAAKRQAFDQERFNRPDGIAQMSSTSVALGTKLSGAG